MLRPVLWGWSPRQFSRVGRPASSLWLVASPVLGMVARQFSWDGRPPILGIDVCQFSRDGRPASSRKMVASPILRMVALPVLMGMVAPHGLRKDCSALEHRILRSPKEFLLDHRAAPYGPHCDLKMPHTVARGPLHECASFLNLHAS